MFRLSRQSLRAQFLPSIPAFLAVAISLALSPPLSLGGDEPATSDEPSSDSPARGKRPNILFAISDDQSWPQDDIWEAYPRVSSLRWFPEPEWIKDKSANLPSQHWLEKRRPC